MTKNNIIHIKQIMYNALLGIAKIMKNQFHVTAFWIQDSIIYAETPDNSCLVAADMSVHQGGINMAIILRDDTLKLLTRIKSSKAITVTEEATGEMLILAGSHHQVEVPKGKLPDAPLHMPVVGQVIGVPLAGYPVDDLVAIVGKQASPVWLLGFNGQLEQLLVTGSYPYTFTSNMTDVLNGKAADFSVVSKHAFKFFPRRHQIVELGQNGGSHWLKVTSKEVALGVDLVVFEKVVVTAR